MLLFEVYLVKLHVPQDRCAGGWMLWRVQGSCWPNPKTRRAELSTGPSISLWKRAVFRQ